MLIACALIPRLSLTSVLEDREGLLGRPVALAPEPGGPQVDRRGIRSGGGVWRASGNAARRGALALPRARAGGGGPGPRRGGLGGLAAPPGGARSRGRAGAAGRGVLRPRATPRPLRRSRLGALEGTPGARVAGATRRRPEPAQRSRRGGTDARPPAGADRRSADSFAAGRRTAGKHPARQAARRVGGRAQIPDTLERLGVRTLGELAKLPAGAVADRFGEPGLAALRLARGADEPLRPRSAPEQLVERIRLPEAASGSAARARSRVARRAPAGTPGAGGKDDSRVADSRPGSPPAAAGARRSRCEAPAPAPSGSCWRSSRASASFPARPPGSALRALELGPEVGEQAALAHSPRDRRRGRLAEAVHQVRATAGRDSLLRVVEVDPGSRVPERRAILTPWSADDG